MLAAHSSLIESTFAFELCIIIGRYTDALSAIAACPSDLLRTSGLQSLFYAVCRHVQDQKEVDA